MLQAQLMLESKETLSYSQKKCDCISSKGPERTQVIFLILFFGMKILMAGLHLFSSTLGIIMFGMLINSEYPYF